MNIQGLKNIIYFNKPKDIAVIYTNYDIGTIGDISEESF